uniref:Uncharacterized protein n=1 Tax=Rhizophora mucronata TaxID=61149 RepID=A0A2P2PEK6_RHIMU
MIAQGLHIVGPRERSNVSCLALFFIERLFPQLRTIVFKSQITME